MLLNILHMITGFIVLEMRLTIEEIAGEERMILIGQFIQLQGSTWRLNSIFTTC